MSLNFSTKNVRPDLQNEDERKIWWDSIDWNMFQSMVFATMSTGINRIKDVKTAQEFYRRYTLFGIACGSPEPYLTLEFLYEFIGLSTNASTKTLTEFKKTCWEVMSRSADSKLQREIDDTQMKLHGLD
jgi:hypothetical protein